MIKIYKYILKHLDDIIIYGFFGYLFVYGILKLSDQNIIYNYILVLLLGIYLGYHIYLYRDRYLGKK